MKIRKIIKYDYYVVNCEVKTSVELLKSIVEASDIVTLAENLRDFTGPQTRRNQEKLGTFRPFANVANRKFGHIIGGFFNTALIP